MTLVLQDGSPYAPPLALLLAHQAVMPNHDPWVGENQARCPYCHARQKVEAAGLAIPRTASRIPMVDDEWENEELPDLAQRVAAALADGLK